MSYSIYIGERMNHEPDEDENPRSDFAKSESHPDAPRFDNDYLTENSNGRHPAYAGWYNFVDRAGLTDLFFNNKTGLMREHEGCENITSEHLKQVQDALTAWPKDKQPGFGENEGKDGILARLIWLEWWMRWAIENCKTPCLSNT